MKEKYDDKELIIDLNDIVKWLKVQKGNIKRILVNNFKEHVDYTIEKVEKKIKSYRGTTRAEKIMITPDCCKSLCMLSQTEKAKEVRQYFIEIEKTMRKYHNEIEENLKKKIGILKTNQKPKLDIKGGIIYILKALNTDETLYKIGKTENIKNRMKNYNSGNGDTIEPLFILEVKDIYAVETCLKGLLKQYQYRKYKEVYEVDLDIIKRACFECDAVHESFTKFLKKNTTKKINEQFKKLKVKDASLFIIVDKN